MDPLTIEDALQEKCKNRSWLVWILLLTASPTILNAAHLASYVFLGGDPSFFCNIPELVEANWTKEQIRQISSPGIEQHSCVHYAWNYTLLKELGFDEALIYYNITEKPDVKRCSSYIYEEEVVHQTIVSEWDLVCDDMPLRSTAQGSVAVGKISGASVFGLISDRFGRKKTFIFAAIIFMIAAPSAAFVNSYGMFIALRLLIGFASAGVYETAYTILMEITVKNYRIYLGNIFNIAYSIGLISLPVAAYFTNNWRHLQLAISVPMFALIIHCWFLPESPRWLLTRGKLEKKSNIRGSGSGYHLDYNEPLQSGSSNIKNNSESWCQKVLFFLKGYLKLFSTFELTKRTLICSYLWFLASLYYYIIALNGTNFGVDPYLYMALNGIIDLPGCLLPIFLLTYFGRKSSGIALYTIFGMSMAVLTVLPQGWPIMFVTLVGRLLGIAAGGIIPFHVVELFPTENRNTAVGSCIAVSQFGPLIAPYIVGIGGKTLWWIPTAICGFLTILGALLLLLLPETRDSPMLDTILEMKTIKKEAR